MEFKTKSMIGGAIAVLVAIIFGLYIFVVNHNDNKIANNTVTDFSISSDAIVSVLASNFVANTVCYRIADANYALPSKKWFETSFSSSYANFLFQLKESKYKKEENDCDDYARSCAFFAQLLHHNTIRKLQDTGIAVGEFWYTRDIGGDHAINFFLSRDDKGAVKVFFYEPQTQQIVTLSKKELESCSFWRL